MDYSRSPLPCGRLLANDPHPARRPLVESHSAAQLPTHTAGNALIDRYVSSLSPEKCAGHGAVYIDPLSSFVVIVSGGSDLA